MANPTKTESNSSQPPQPPGFGFKNGNTQNDGQKAGFLLFGQQNQNNAPPQKVEFGQPKEQNQPSDQLKS